MQIAGQERGARPAAQAGRAREDNLISVDEINVDLYGMRILENVSFTVGEGEIVAVIGPSGCGKTTLLRVLAGLVTPSQGEVRIGGEQVLAPRRDLAVVFQDYGKALLPWRNARDNIALALEARSIPKSQHAERIQPLLSLVGLSEHAEKFPRQLSGGMQQRVQIARALALEPRVLLMDEPFGALDAMTRRTLQDEMLSIAERTGKTIFFVTHDLEEAIYIGDRVLGLLPRPGRLSTVFEVDLPRPRDQIATPEHPSFVKIRRQLFDFIHSAEGK
jgi:NitT/TauT family transport system ATP-binding protein